MSASFSKSLYGLSTTAFKFLRAVWMLALTAFSINQFCWYSHLYRLKVDHSRPMKNSSSELVWVQQDWSLLTLVVDMKQVGTEAWVRNWLKCRWTHKTAPMSKPDFMPGVVVCTSCLAWVHPFQSPCAPPLMTQRMVCFVCPLWPDSFFYSRECQRKHSNCSGHLAVWFGWLWPSYMPHVPGNCKSFSLPSSSFTLD